LSQQRCLRFKLAEKSAKIQTQELVSASQDHFQFVYVLNFLKTAQKLKIEKLKSALFTGREIGAKIQTRLKTSTGQKSAPKFKRKSNQITFFNRIKL
jgi:hypothetical protein